MSALERYADNLEALHDAACAENAELRRRIDLLALWCASMDLPERLSTPDFWRKRAAEEAR